MDAATQQRIMSELVAGVSNLLGPNSGKTRTSSTVMVPNIVCGVIHNHARGREFIDRGIAEIEDSLGAVADVQGIWGELDDA